MDGAQATAKVKTTVDAGVGIITLSDPGTLNAAGLDLMAELTAAFEDFAYGDKARAIVITGEGRGFCSGANLSGGGGAARTPTRCWNAPTRRSTPPNAPAAIAPPTRSAAPTQPRV
jgi:enoyl-CoA hydratase/carnithine racemase